MSARPVRLLHVEDDAVQRKLVSAHLARLTAYRFTVEHAGDENEAVEKFRSGYDCVLLDYNLSSGDGLQCLRRLRELNPGTPVIAISGTASPKIAADLLEAGADDYLSKSGFDTETLARCLAAALARADAFRNRAPELGPDVASALSMQFRAVCEEAVEKLGNDFLSKLDALEADARKARLSMAQMLRFFETSCDTINYDATRSSSLKRVLRPVMFELVYRLFDESPAPMAG